MNFRPAGYSSDEDDAEFNNFSFHGDVKTEKERQEEIALEIYNKRQELDNTATNRFYSALTRGNLDLIREEIKNGFDVNCHIISDWTPLFLAAAQGNSLIVEELLKNGADVNSTRDGLTTLMAVCECSKNSSTADNIVTTVQYLLNYDVSVEAVDRKRRTAFMLCCSQGFLEVVKILFPLSRLEAQDNQGWTALFYAINANEPEIVKYLIENGANVDHTDIRNNNIKYYATLNDYQEILAILPKDETEIIPNDICINVNDYVSIFNLLEGDDRPKFTEDISFLLFGMKCQNLVPIFIDNNIDLLTFLTTNDQKLQDLGILMSFQRNRILQGLFNFHKYLWKKNSIPFAERGDTYTTFDMFVAITNTIKHLIIMEASIIYLRQNLVLTEGKTEKNLPAIKTSMILKKINRIKKVVYLLQKKSMHFDEVFKGSADLITKDIRFKKNLLKKKVVIGFAGITVYFVLRYCKSWLL